MSAMLAYVSSLPGKLSDLELPKKISNCGPWTKTCLTAATAYSAYQGLELIYTHYRKHINDRKRDAKRQENRKSIEELHRRIKQNPLSEAEVQRITHLSLVDLVEELKSGKIRPINALRAYQTQALQAHQKTNCLVEAIVEAEERALELEKGPKEGLLWGVPISIKDDIGIKGYDSTMGMVERAGQPAEEDCSMLKVLLQHGAVPFVKTNVPQSEMSYEPGNPINGIVHNPHSLHRGPGGSSSGEAALIALYGSPLGVGSDLGGSIRVPAHFCGIQGFKPTPERNSHRGISLDGPAFINTFKAAWGPLSRDVDGLVLMMRALWEDYCINKFDPAITWQSFDQKEYNSNRKLRIGYFTDIPTFPTFTACKRAVQETVDLLSKQGHEIVPWQPPQIELTTEIALALLKADGGVPLKELLIYDKIHPTIGDGFLKGHFIPDNIRKVLDKIIRPFSAQTADKLDLCVGPCDTLTFMERGYSLVQWRRLVHDAWTEAKLDAVICPPNVMVAPPFGSSALLLGNGTYTFFYNLLHYPAGVVHTTNVTDSDLKMLDRDYPNASDPNQKAAKAAMTSSAGLPVGVMVATPCYRDETCLRVMKIIEENQKI